MQRTEDRSETKLERFKELVSRATSSVMWRHSVENHPAWAGIALGLKLVTEALRENETAVAILQRWAAGDFRNEAGKAAFADVFELGRVPEEWQAPD